MTRLSLRFVRNLRIPTAVFMTAFVAVCLSLAVVPAFADEAVTGSDGGDQDATANVVVYDSSAENDKSSSEDVVSTDEGSDDSADALTTTIEFVGNSWRYLDGVPRNELSDNGVSLLSVGERAWEAATAIPAVAILDKGIDAAKGTARLANAVQKLKSKNKVTEKLVRIIDQLPLTSRAYTAQDGAQRTFHSRGFLLTDGIDEFYAEMTGDTALSCPELDRNVLHQVQAQIRQRAYQDKNGATRYENQIYITRLV